MLQCLDELHITGTDGPYVALASESARWFKSTDGRSACTARDADIMTDGGSKTIITNKNSSNRGSSNIGRGRGSAWESGLNDIGSIE